MLGPVLATALLLLAAAQPAAACRSRNCPDQRAIDDLRARVTARCDCAGAASRRDWVRCVKQVTEEAIASGVVSKGCARAAHRCEAKATCGRDDAVVCCQARRSGVVAGRITKRGRRCRGTICTANPTAADACRPDATCAPPPLRDPGVDTWEPVARERIAEECGLEPALLDAADAALQRPYAIVRHGRLCHEYYPPGRSADEVNEAFSTTKTLGALLTGIAAWETRDFPRTGRKTGPISELDRVDHWLDAFTFNLEARIVHVLAMIAHNPDLSYGNRGFQYDLVGQVQINRLSDVIETAIQQDPERLGGDVEEFTQRFLYAPLGMTSSIWSGGAPDKVFGFTWNTTVRDMARVGLLLLNGGLWNGERVLSADWVYGMTHPSFEDTNPAYGFLTWLSVASEDGISRCAPPALHETYPHGLSEAPDCGFPPLRSCEQEYDVGVWAALGLGGQIITGHRGLDLVLIAKDANTVGGIEALWSAVRPALVARDPRFPGDEVAFCAAYDASTYAPDLRR